jgi:hypothetical protein
MEEAGGINEIYNFYVGQTLTNSYNRASASFYARLGYAYGVDYTDQAAISSIAGISQAEANWFINQGAALAATIGYTYGCTPGSLTNMAVNLYAADVSRKKDSVNSQISSVKAGKQQDHDNWVAELERLAELEAEQKRLSALGAFVDAYMHRNDAVILAAQLAKTTSSELASWSAGKATQSQPDAPYNVYVLINSDALAVFGHSAIALISSSNKVHLYSYQSTNGYPFESGAVSTEFRQPYTYDFFMEDSGAILQGTGSGDYWVEHYDHYIALDVSTKQWTSMNQYARDFSNNPSDYNVLTHNCYDFVRDVLTAGEVSLVDDTPSYYIDIPNARYNNFNGAYNVDGYTFGLFE